MQTVRVYGFGSFFQSERSPGDIDLLLLHTTTSLESCALAIQCKSVLRDILPQTHITMLSEPEERSLNFLARCGGVYIGALDETTIEVNAGNLAADILKWTLKFVSESEGASH